MAKNLTTYVLSAKHVDYTFGKEVTLTNDPQFNEISDKMALHDIFYKLSTIPEFYKASPDVVDLIAYKNYEKYIIPSQHVCNSNFIISFYNYVVRKTVDKSEEEIFHFLQGHREILNSIQICHGRMDEGIFQNIYRFFIAFLSFTGEAPKFTIEEFAVMKQRIREENSNSLGEIENLLSKIYQPGYAAPAIEKPMCTKKKARRFLGIKLPFHKKKYLTEC